MQSSIGYRQNSPRQNPPRQTPPQDKTPQDKTPPRQKPPRQNPPKTKTPKAKKKEKKMGVRVRISFGEFCLGGFCQVAIKYIYTMYKKQLKNWK